MRKATLLLCLLSTTFVGKGQNLVPNGDFEQYYGCPNSLSQIDSALFWFSPSIGTPDYFNQCAVAFANVPNTFWGFQQAYNGDAFGGILLWTSVSSEEREYMEVPISSALIANQCYHFEMHINSPNNFQFITDAIAVYFSDTLINGVSNSNTLPYIPQVNNLQGNFADTLNWTIVSGDFNASGGESYLIIGNFKDDFNTDLIIANSNGSYPLSYVFIDDVSLTPCTGIQEQNQNEAFTIYPNPVKDELTVSSKQFGVKAEIIITDILGKEVLKFQILNPESQIKINVQSLKDGVYFIEIDDEKNSYRKKFMKSE